MRERIIQVIVLVIAVIVGVLGTLYFLDKDNVQTTSSKNVTISEEDSISEAVDKIYNSVVVVENISNGQAAGSGSGFVYKKDSKYGYILTNYHVVNGATSLKVVTMDNNEVDATYLGGDSYTDVAVLRIAADKVLDVASIGDSSKSSIGDTVFTVGTPVGTTYMGTVTKGILSGVNREVTLSDSDNGSSYMIEVLQTDASINPGNSGGPLVNINGEVIGITSSKLVNDEIEGMGFAIPIELATSEVDELEKGQSIERPYIGVSLYDVSNSNYFSRYNFDIDSNITSGVVIASVEENGDAAKAGLKAGDVVLSIDGTKVDGPAKFKYILYKHSIGDTVKVHINRGGSEKDIEMKLTQTLGSTKN